jgi:hypothetical protein
MLAMKPQKDDEQLIAAIDALYVKMSELSPDSNEYSAVVDQLQKLHSLKDNSKSYVSPDTLAIVAGNLAGILLIVGHERAHVVTSKAVNFLLKLR